MNVTAFLIVAHLASTTGSWQFKPYPFPGGMDACNKAVAAGKTDVADGGDAEGAIALFCSESEWPATDRHWVGDGWVIKPYKREGK